MKGFDSYLQRSVRTEPVDWSQHYVHYVMLKKQLRAYSKRRKELLGSGNDMIEMSSEDWSLLSSPIVADDAAENVYFEYQEQDEQGPGLFHRHELLKRISTMERTEFCALLESELYKASEFFSRQLAQLESSVSALAQEQKDDEDHFVKVGSEILEVFSFMGVNIIALQQILLRYDAFVRTHDGAPLSDWYLQRQLRRDHDNIENKKHNLLDLDSLEDIQASFLLKLMSQHQEPKRDEYEKDFLKQFEQFRTLLDTTFDSMERAAGGHVVFQDRIIYTLRRYFLVGSVFSSLSMEPNILLMRGRHLKREMKALARWREKNTLCRPDYEKYRMDPENILPLALNLISCFLFMMNNYIIEPSSAYYAEALGSNDAMSGIMIGAAPWFALVSAVAYSFWTNHSYKRPILFAACLMLVGNLLYANAYSYQSMEMCLIGRAITGLGAPRIINRRYVADATPFSLRTAASAAFALATALGAALGPGMAIVLDLLEFEFTLPLLGTQYFNGMTGPGYFMAVSWTLYAIAILLTFKEPNRSGLDELKRREAAEASRTTALMETLDNDDDSQSADIELKDTLSMQLKTSSSFDSTVDSYGEDDTEFSGENQDPANNSSPLHCIRHMTLATALCMSLIFMKRIALESIVGSTSVITKNRYGWSIKNVGVLHTINGTIVIPVSILSGWLSQFYEDRYLAIWLLGVTLFGMAFMVDVTDLVSADNDTYNESHWLAVGPVKYVAGSLIAFSGIEACESYVASLMSKVVPSALAVGTFNSGLLTTLVGTSGRATGDLFITAMGLISIRQLLNLLIIPGMALLVLSIFLIVRYYEILAV